MPILGKIYARPYECRVASMTVGEEAFINPEEITVTRSAVFLDIDTRIFFRDDLTKRERLRHVRVRRIGPTLTSKDFELTFTQTIDYEFQIETESMYLYLSALKKYVLEFKEFEISLNGQISKERQASGRTKVTAKNTIADLERQRENAVRKEDYETATRLRDEIRERRKGGEE